MNVLYALLIILLISLCETAEPCTDGVDAADAASCHNRDKPEEGGRCCYHNEQYYSSGTMHVEKKCHPMKKNDFEKFVSIYKSKKNGITALGGSIDTLEWNCSSNYLYISLLSLMVLIL